MSRQELTQLADFREMAEAHLERLGAAIWARRDELGWSRADLGRMVSAHEKTVERWEKAQTAGAMDHIEEIARALDMDADDLLAAAVKPRTVKGTPDLFSSDQLDRIEEALAEMRQELADLRARDAAVAARDEARELQRKHKPPAARKRKARGK